jgi:hypothetical protein
MTGASTTPTRPGQKVTVTPSEFTFVAFDAAEIERIVTELAELLEVANPIRVVVDETTPLAKLYETLDGMSSDSVITLHAESGALEDRKHPMSFSPSAARESLGRVLLRASDRLHPEFADAPADLDLTLAENAAWDTYCAGRLARLGVATNKQRWQYNHRNRFGFSDAVDLGFERLWSAEGLSWSQVARGGAQ